MTDSPQTPTAASTPSVAPVAAPPAAQSDELLDIETFLRTKLRLGKVVAVEAVPKSKKLYKLQVDLGATLGTRQILSGIAQFYTPEQLLGRQIVVVSNLKPAKLMGLESQGMLLAASTEDDSQLALIGPDKEIPPGSRVR